MKPIYSPASPYVRKVRVLAIEAGLAAWYERFAARPSMSETRPE